MRHEGVHLDSFPPHPFWLSGRLKTIRTRVVAGSLISVLFFPVLFFSFLSWSLISVLFFPRSLAYFRATFFSSLISVRFVPRSLGLFPRNFV